jgi:hypothetical protein
MLAEVQQEAGEGDRLSASERELLKHFRSVPVAVQKRLLLLAEDAAIAHRKN